MAWAEGNDPGGESVSLIGGAVVPHGTPPCGHKTLYAGFLGPRGGAQQGRSGVQHNVGAWIRRRRVGVVPVLVVAPLMLASACFGASSAEERPKPPAAQVTIEPQDGTEKVRPEDPIKIAASKGTLQSVSVKSSKDRVLQGELSPDRTTWTSRWTLHPSTSYDVEATAVNPDGRETQVKSSFSTLDPKSSLDASSVIEDGQKVGVGMPIIVNFDSPVYNKKNVERALEVRTSEAVTGAWYWMNRQEVHFRPKKYWPANSKVRLVGHLTGVRAGKGMYGTDDLNVNFKIGDKHISKIDTNDHTMTVKENGDKIKTFPMSAGRSSYPTTSGTHVVFERSPVVVMDSATVGIPKGSPEYYRITAYWTVKFTFSGLYTHSAPWSLYAQGNSNVSHGCINLSPDRAKWFYDWSLVGDIIKITGTPRELEWGNGWTDWEKPWDEWLEGSALDEPVKTNQLDGTARSPSPTSSATGSPTSTSSPTQSP
ncbi:MAG: L,D-transpeptidase family protein [Streptosporangiales bacterium]|nr:L,D-transpeptidase family protein [Streptosporangiales bacterium]